jgi:hypothetical protein
MNLSKSLALITICSLLLSCGEEAKNPFNSNYDNDADPKFLYVVSGGCYAGGVAVTANGSSVLSRFIRATGEFDRVIYDFAANANGDIPVTVIDKNKDELYVIVENAGGRRIETINKDSFDSSIYLTNTTALTGVIRHAALLNDNSILVSKSTAIEKFSSSRTRVQMGANAYVQTPAGACATTATLITALGVLANGNIIYAHSAASPNNKINVISSTGYAAAPNCLSSIVAPNTTALPTALLNHSSGKLLVAYGSTTATSNFVYSYDVNLTTNVISNPILAYQDLANLNGPSAMTEDPVTGHILIANGNATFNNVQRFELNTTNGTLTLVDPTPFMPATLYSRCISSMTVGY